MLGASTGLEVSEMVLTKCRNPDESDEVTTWGSSNEATTLSVSMEPGRMESRPYSEFAAAWSRKE